jgi:cysteine-rich repeat protein
VTTGESCDDGNVVSGDGCHAYCVSETEIEPNDDTTPSTGGSGRDGNDFDAVAVEKADANGAIHDAFVMSAAIATAGDEDVFALENLSAYPVLYTIQTGEDATGVCPDADTVVTIRDATGMQLAQDDDSGQGNCSQLRYIVPAGTRVYVHVTEYGDNAAIAAYVISFSPCGDMAMGGGEPCDDGNAIDGDTCDSNCTIPGCSNGILDPTEACDDGNTANGDGCDMNCTMTGCGNSISTTGEACDDGNAINADGCDVNCTVSACGNGVVAGTEVCDDMNVVSGDGCDVNCTPTGCGNGVRTGTEACDDGNMVLGDGGENDCTVSPTCGNGMADPGEGCDDHNTTSADGCSASCAPEAGWMCSGTPTTCVSTCGDGTRVGTEQCDDGNTTTTDCCVACSALCSTPEIEPNDAYGAATAITTGASGAITVGDHDYYAITLMVPANVRIETFDGSGGACAGIDTYITLYGPDGTSTVLSDDDDGLNACSLLEPVGDTSLRNLAAGTYYLMVRAYSATTAIPAYQVRVTLQNAGCGDGFPNAGEQCEDSNVAAGDGCSPTCQIEAVAATETEPNDDGTHATGGTGIVGNDIDATAITAANANGAYSVSTIVSGALTPAGDEDLFAVTNPGTTPIMLRAETGAPTIGTCTGDTGIRVLDGALAEIARDDDGGPGACSLVASVVIPPGVTYYVQVVEYGDDAAIASYQLYLRFF